MAFSFAELDQTKLVTRADPEECLRRGQYCNDEDITNGLDTLLPLARQHTGTFTGYDAKMLAELEYLAQVHAQAVPKRKDQAAGGKKGSRKAEAQTIQAGKDLLRECIEGLETAIITRSPAEGETPEDYAESNVRFLERLAALKGDIGSKPVPLRTKLENASTLLAEPKLSSRLAELMPAGKNLAAEVTALVSRLPSASQEKKSQQQAAKTNTADLDRLQGLIYFNLKRFTKAGRSHYLTQGDTATASMFNLNSINKSGGRKAGGSGGGTGGTGGGTAGTGGGETSGG